MFKVLAELFGLITLTISSVSDLATAGKYQTEIIKDSSEFDARKKRAKLNADYEAYNKQLEAEPTIQSADLKKAA
jgi:hypothetical protein